MLNRFKVPFMRGITVMISLFILIMGVWNLINTFQTSTDLALDIQLTQIVSFYIICLLSAFDEVLFERRYYLKTITITGTWIASLIILVFFREHMYLLSFYIIPIFSFVYMILIGLSRSAAIKKDIVRPGVKKTLPRAYVSRNGYLLYWVLSGFYGFLLFDFVIIFHTVIENQLRHNLDVCLLAIIGIVIFSFLNYITITSQDELNMAAKRFVKDFDMESLKEAFLKIETAPLEEETRNYEKFIKAYFYLNYSYDEAKEVFEIAYPPNCPEYVTMFYVIKSLFLILDRDFAEAEKTIGKIRKWTPSARRERKRLVLILKLFRSELTSGDIKRCFKRHNSNLKKLQNAVLMMIYYHDKKIFSSMKIAREYVLQNSEAFPEIKAFASGLETAPITAVA